jgi:hypothetical protein
VSSATLRARLLSAARARVCVCVCVCVCARVCVCVCDWEEVGAPMLTESRI